MFSDCLTPSSVILLHLRTCWSGSTHFDDAGLIRKNLAASHIGQKVYGRTHSAPLNAAK
jgi:hypothetical protein